jgi:hypothetical protein
MMLVQQPTTTWYEAMMLVQQPTTARYEATMSVYSCYHHKDFFVILIYLTILPHYS